MKKQPIHLHTEFGLKLIGTLITGDDGVKTLRCSRKRSLHYFEKDNGWAVDKKVLNGLIKQGLDYIEIDSVEESMVYHSPVKNFQKYGKNIDYGHGSQVVLNSCYWTKIDKE